MSFRTATLAVTFFEHSDSTDRPLLYSFLYKFYSVVATYFFPCISLHRFSAPPCMSFVTNKRIHMLQLYTQCSIKSGPLGVFAITFLNVGRF